MTGFQRRQFVALLCGGLCVVGVSSCGETGPAVETPQSLGLLPWSDRARLLFDDNIEPAAVGYTVDIPSARGDKFLRERATSADLVARFRVQTVTVETIGDDSTYHIGVRVMQSYRSKPRITDPVVEVVIKPPAPAFGIAKALDQRMQGQTFIGFISRFASADGQEVELHWHFSPDSQDVDGAVKEALALAEASGR